MMKGNPKSKNADADWDFIAGNGIGGAGAIIAYFAKSEKSA